MAQGGREAVTFSALESDTTDSSLPSGKYGMRYFLLLVTLLGLQISLFQKVIIKTKLLRHFSSHWRLRILTLVLKGADWAVGLAGGNEQSAYTGTERGESSKSWFV